MTEQEAAIEDLKAHEKYVVVLWSVDENGQQKIGVHTHDEGEGALMLAEAKKILNA